MPEVEQHHWLNTIVGLLDQAFFLTDDEQVHVIRIVSSLLDELSIPERGPVAQLPPPLALELEDGLYTAQMSGPRSSGLVRKARTVHNGDIVLPLETWRESFMSMVDVAYPDLDPTERLIASKTLTELLAAIGLPDRAALFFPEDVVRAATTIDR